jgi:hypothetical protein
MSNYRRNPDESLIPCLSQKFNGEDQGKRQFLLTGSANVSGFTETTGSLAGHVAHVCPCPLTEEEFWESCEHFEIAEIR